MVQKMYHSGIREAYTRIRHKSGLTVCVLQKPSAVTCASLGVRCGGIDRKFRIHASDMLSPVETVPEGCAHFLEHKLFAEQNGEDAIARFAAVGANADAYTTPDITVYLFNTSENEDKALAILLDFVMHPYFTEENVERERGIITQEIRMYDDSPSQLVYNNLMEALYHTHPIRGQVGGTESSVAEITPEILYRFYRAFYHPANMVLTVAGNMTPEDVIRICDEYLPDTLPPFTTERIFDAEPETIRKPCTEAYAQTAAPLLCIGVKDRCLLSDPTERERRAAAIDILNDIMFCKSSALYHDLYEKGLINGPFSFEYDHGETYAYVLITAETEQPEQAAEAIRAYIRDRVSLHDITDEAFERCRRVMYAGAVTAFESTEDMAAECLDSAIDGGELFASVDIMMAVTKEDLFRVLDALYDPAAFAVSVVFPDGKS